MFKIKLAHGLVSHSGGRTLGHWAGRIQRQLSRFICCMFKVIRKLRVCLFSHGERLAGCIHGQPRIFLPTTPGPAQPEGCIQTAHSGLHESVLRTVLIATAKFHTPLTENFT